MRIINKTQWRTDDLRAIFARVLAENSKIEGPFKSLWFIGGKAKKGLEITVVNSRQQHRLSGCAWLHTGAMTIRLPKAEARVELAAYVFEHELMHCRGYRHGSMPSFCGTAAWEAGSKRYAYLSGLPLRLQEPKPVPRAADGYPAELAALRLRIKRLESKLKGTATRLKKAHRRERYIAKQLGD